MANTDHNIKPSWLKVKIPSHQNFFKVSKILKENKLHTICQSAKCPNVSECWSQKTATFMIMGDVCTRNCSFCAVKHGTPIPVSETEPVQIANAVSSLELKYVVITSVTRDDLKDGGASFFAETITAIRDKMPEAKIEVLIPDFNGALESLEKVVEAGPDVINHNVETTNNLYTQINRPPENYDRSLNILENAKKMGAFTKSGMMIGLGEEKKEILQTLSDLRGVSCELLTIGQYLQASKNNIPVKKFYCPEEFNQLKKIAYDLGFIHVESGPLVRSSYKASNMYHSIFSNMAKN
ncbi:MAG: lipoyl synthase [Candidatus Aminicenantaceae bacterium]